MEATLEMSREDFQWAASRGLLTDEQAEELWNQLQLRHRDRPRLTSSQVAYYLGAGIVLIGMSWLLGMAWSQMWGGLVVFGIAAAYVIVFFGTGYYLYHKSHKPRPGGLLVTVAVCVVPIAVYGLQLVLGLWYRPSSASNEYYNPFFDFTNHSLKELVNFMPMELSLLLAAIVTLEFFAPFPFLIAPIVSVVWYMTMDWVSTLVALHGPKAWDQVDLWTSMAFGMICTAGGFALELLSCPNNENNQHTKDRAYWITFVGVFTFWFGLLLFYMKTEWGELLRCFASVGIIVLAVVLKRRLFMGFGVIGILVYLAHLNDLFGDWILLPFVVTVVGVVVIAFGLYRNKVANDEMAQSLLHHTDTGVVLENVFVDEDRREATTTAVSEPETEAPSPSAPSAENDDDYDNNGASA